MASTSGWDERTEEGVPGNNSITNNTSGFNAYPVGYRSNNGIFVNQNNDSPNFDGGYAILWSSTESNSGAYFRDLDGSDVDLDKASIDKGNGATVRFVRDTSSVGAADILLNGTVSAENNQIKNIADPSDAQDAVTKNYTYSKEEVNALIEQALVNLQSQIDDLNSGNENDETPRTFNLLSLGDSYTIGQSVCESCSFPEQLKDSLIENFNEQDVFSLEIIAQTGWTTTNLKSAIASSNPSTDFDLVTLLIGVNNQYQNKPISLYQTEFVELIDTAISLVGGEASKLIVISIPDYAYTPFGQNSNPETISEELETYNNYAQSYCNANGLTYVYITDITQQGISNPDLVAADNLHPSSLSYSMFVERILPFAIEKIE